MATETGPGGDSSAPRRGKLTVFLGAVAGVGKTLAMLESAGRLAAGGVDVVIGHAETHGQAELEPLLASLRALPRRPVSGPGSAPEGPDLDALIARRPQLVLFDDLARSNPPGARHPHRYQDAWELLWAGIDVYGTLNIHDLESTADVVGQITGIRISAGVPDLVLSQADEVRLVDLPPAEVMERLARGLVAVPPHLRAVAGQLYRPGNLHALRELALRQMAQWVDQQMQKYMGAHGIHGPWPAGERVLVCIGPGPMSERLVRAGARLAAELHADWVALHVETPFLRGVSGSERESLNRNLRLVDHLGGKAVTVTALDIVDGILQYARRHNMSKIVIGQPLRPRWRDLLHGSLVDRVIRQAGAIDVHVISSARDHLPERRWDWQLLLTGSWQAYAVQPVLVGAVTGLSAMSMGHQAPTNVILFYLLVVVVTGLRWGLGPAVLASVLGALAFDFFFTPPYHSLWLADVQYVVTFTALLLVALVVGTLTGRLRDYLALARRREAETGALYDFSRRMVAALDAREAADALVRHVGAALGHQAGALLLQDGSLRLCAATPGFQLSDDDTAAAGRALAAQTATGRGQAVPGETGCALFPLRTKRQAVGILAIGSAGPRGPLTPDERRLAESCAAQAAMAIERAQLEAQARRAHLLAEADRLHTAVLNSISHDLRTPLASVIGALTTVRDQGARLDEDTRRELLETARDEAERLNRLVGNLLDMTRLESGRLRLASDWCDMQDLVGMALDQMGRFLAGRPLQVMIPRDLPLVFVDYVLIGQVLKNLLENAAKHSPAGAPIDITAHPVGDGVEVQVSDRGSGIPPADLERVFDRFYRVERPDGPAGTGLGLAVCKGVVEAHGGRIWAARRAGGGTTFTFTLPTHPRDSEGGNAVGHRAE